MSDAERATDLSDLLHCPFCSSEGWITGNEGELVKCDECNILVPIKVWQTRPNRELSREARRRHEAAMEERIQKINDAKVEAFKNGQTAAMDEVRKNPWSLFPTAFLADMASLIWANTDWDIVHSQIEAELKRREETK